MLSSALQSLTHPLRLFQTVFVKSFFFSAVFGVCVLSLGCSNHRFSMQMQSALISLPAGGSTNINIDVFTSDPTQTVSIRCRGIAGADLPSMIECPTSQTFSGRSSTLSFPVKISADAAPDEVSIEIVGYSLGHEQAIPVQIQITDWENFGGLKAGTTLYTRTAWYREIGTDGTDEISSLVVDSEGGVYTAGQTTGSFIDQTNLGGYDGFFIKYQPSGSLDFLVQFGTSGSDVVSAMAIDANHQIYMTGYTYDTFQGQASAGRADAYVAKFYSNGKQAWIKQLGTTEIDKGMAITVDAQGHIYVLGTTEGSFPGFTNAGGVDLFLLQFQPDGSLGWTKQFGTMDDDGARSILMLSTGDILLGGNTMGSFAEQTSAGSLDAWLALYSPFGSQTWVKQFGTYADDGITALTIDKNGMIYAAGNTQGRFPHQSQLGGQDGFFLALQPDGTTLGPYQFGTYSSDEVRSLSIYEGLLLVSGFTKGKWGNSSAGVTDVFVAGFDSEHLLFGVKQFGTSDMDFATSMAVQSDHLYVAGTTFGSFSSQTNQGESDGFLTTLQLIEK